MGRDSRVRPGNSVIGLVALRRTWRASRDAGRASLVVISLLTVALAVTSTLACWGWGAGPTGASTPISAPTMAASHPYRCTNNVCSGLVKIAHGRSIYLECEGVGKPTVVLVAGQGGRANDWTDLPDSKGVLTPSPNAVYPEVAKFTRVCAYDRPGTTSQLLNGLELTPSTPVQQPVTARGSAADLNAVLTASRGLGPFVLVGQSYGGDVIRVYASEHPKMTAGLVLVDALSEYLATYLSPTQLKELQRLNSPATQGRPAGSEYSNYKAVFAQLHGAAVPRVPVIVLTADKFLLTPEVLAAHNLPRSFSKDLWAAQQKAQARLAGLFPGAKWVTKTDASHYIQWDQPQLVTNAVREVVDKVRGRANPSTVNLKANAKANAPAAPSLDGEENIP
jgi:pimeloyl-ACP methyl ester carboxylesterase